MRLLGLGTTLLVNSDAPGIQNKGFADVEIVTEKAGRVARIGKNRGVSQQDTFGEFGGVVRFSDDVRSELDAAMELLFGTDILPWWLEPQTSSLCDLLQYLVDRGVAFTPVKISHGWHEVNTQKDLIRAQNDTALFLSEEDVRSQVLAMGACFLSEANDLKRPLSTVAVELNVSFSKIQGLLKGDLELNDALEVLRKMSLVYPVPLNDLWLEADDTTCGVRFFTREASEASARILDRPDVGGRTPYYEYRDAAMSRCGQFRPEWIRELRVVDTPDPLDSRVQLNNGHLMMQTTLFIGPVNFYYKDASGVHCMEMNTGDSNFISPFVPHSFTSRDAGVDAIIIAVTYGGAVRRAFTEFARCGSSCVFSLAGDKRDPQLLRRSVMQRHLWAECITAPELAVAAQLPETRCAEISDGQKATVEELRALAAALHVKLSDLWVSPFSDAEEVVLATAAECRKSSRLRSTYRMTPLVRTPHQPDMKTFDVEVLDTALPGESLACGLHSFLYSFGSESVGFTWRGRSAILRPGDSAYVAPFVDFHFSVCTDTVEHNPNGKSRGDGRRIFLVRIPGHLTGETLSEFATFSAQGRDRVGAETMQWYA